MSVFDDVVKEISNCIPEFNRVALTDFTRDNINNSPEFPAMLFREGAKFVDCDLEYLDYEIMSPEERVRFELRPRPGKNRKPRIPLTVSHLRLVKYRLRFQDQYITPKLYTPYMVDDMLFINDKRSVVRKVIVEKTISREKEKQFDGVTVSPVRVNIKFNRRQTFKIVSYVSGELYQHFIVTSRLFYGAIKKKICDTSIIHYMLAKFGMIKTLKKFGLSKSDISFVAEVGQDTEKFDYFAAKAYNDRLEEGPGLYLRVKKTLLSDDQTLKFIVNLMYVTSHFDIQNINNVYVEEGSIWKVILGIILFGNRSEAKAYPNGIATLKSVDSFIDPLTRERFRSFGVMIDDIYDLLVYIFVNIDSFMVNNVSQNIYDSRLDVANGILVQSFANRINHSFYALNKKSNIKTRDVEKALQYNPMMFKQVARTKKDDEKQYTAPPEIVGDNFLLSGGLNKIRMGGKAEQRLHPSMVVVESIDAFVGKRIGKTGYLNPYIPTDVNGTILHPDYAGAVDSILEFLPK